MKRKFPVVRSRVRRFSSCRIPLIANPQPTDLRDQDSGVRDQGQSNECTGYSWTGLETFVRAKKEKAKATEIKSTSPRFVYYLERVLDGNVNRDEGSQMHEGGEVLARWGFCAEKFCKSPSPDLIYQKPSMLAFANATLYKNSTAVALHSIDEMKSCLSSGYPFVCGIDVPTALNNMGATGMMSEADWNTEIEGGHAVLCVGWNEYGLIIKNSWGASFGAAGYFFIPWSHVDAKTFDAYTIR